MTDTPPPAVELRAVTKTYPNGTRAVEDVSFDVRRGEIHAIVGENGAGKSTLMKMLYGLEQPDSGEIRIDGHPVRVGSARAAIDLGIGLVHQHLMLVDSLSVAENVMLGEPPVRRAFPTGGRWPTAPRRWRGATGSRSIRGHGWTACPSGCGSAWRS